MATGGSSSQDDQRVVLLGKIGAGKSSLANRILGRDIFKTEEIGFCMSRQGEHAGRKLTVVDTPGWDRTSVLRTPEKIKQEIIRSVTLCLPGPHALLLVLPISMDHQPPSANEIKSALDHVALLTNRAWRHTIVLFVCKDKMDTSAIGQHVQRAKKLIDRCKGRYFILRNDSDVTTLLQKIEDMVKHNQGNFFIPEVSYEEPDKGKPSGTADKTERDEKREEELKQQHKRESEKMELDFKEKLGKLQQELNAFKTEETKKKGTSSELSPTTMAETSQGGAADQHQDSVKEMGAENKEPDKGMPSGIAEQTEKYEKRVEEHKQPKTESEKMEPDLREKLEKLEQETKDDKTGVTKKKSDSSEFLPPTMAETSQGGAAVQDPNSVKEEVAKNKESDKGMPSGIAEQTEKYEKMVERFQQLYKINSEKMEQELREKLGELKQEINYYKTGVTRTRSNSNDFLPPTMAETSHVRAAIQQQDSVKEMGAENEAFEKRMPSGTAEQTKKYEKREEELKQHYRRISEKMELDIKMKRKINEYKSGRTMKRSNSSEYLPPNMVETSQGGAAVQHQDSVKETGTEDEEPEKGKPSRIAEQNERDEKRVEDLKQLYKRETEKMELDFREELGKLKQKTNYDNTGETTKRSDSKESSPQNKTSQGRAAVQHQDSDKEMVAKNETFEKRKLSRIAEQNKMYEKRVEELNQQYKIESEMMERDFREQLWEHEQDINYYKTGRTMRRSFKLTEELGKLKQEINEYKSGGTMKRRRSNEFLPPTMAETSQGGAAVQHLALNEPFGIVMMAFFGALVGAIVGATDGVKGSAAGVIFGSTIGVLLAVLYIRATRFVMGSGRVAFVVEGGDQTSVRSDS